MTSPLRIVIIGGGPSGLIAAITAKRMSPQSDVLVIEKNDKVGKKILASGNGHCNYSNAHAQPQHYNSPSFVAEIFRQFSPDQTRSWFADLGMLDRMDEQGRCYPYNQLASSVHDVIRLEAERLQVRFLLSTEVTQLELNHRGGWTITTTNGTHDADRVILSTGGKAAPQLGTLGQGYIFAQSLGHHIRPPQPAIVMIQVDKHTIKNLSGVRADIEISLFHQSEFIRKEIGEVLFKEDAVSGICSFILSSFIARSTYPASEFVVEIDTIPDLKEDEIVQWLAKRWTKSPSCGLDELVLGLVHKTIAHRAIESQQLRADRVLSMEQLKKIAYALKHFRIPVIGLGPFMHAQTTSGGILVKEIHRQTLQSKIHPHLFFAGELIDIDGECGGFSLQWAWSSGYVAGLHSVQTK